MRPVNTSCKNNTDKTMPKKASVDKIMAALVAVVNLIAIFCDKYAIVVEKIAKYINEYRASFSIVIGMSFWKNHTLTPISDAVINCTIVSEIASSFCTKRFV